MSVVAIFVVGIVCCYLFLLWCYCGIIVSVTYWYISLLYYRYNWCCVLLYYHITITINIVVRITLIVISFITVTFPLVKRRGEIGNEEEGKHGTRKQKEGEQGDRNKKQKNKGKTI